MNCCYTEDIRLTSWGWYFFPSIHRVVYIAGGAGFLPLTLSWTIICGLWCWRWILLTHRFLYLSLCFHPSVRLTKNNSAKSKRRCEEIQFKDSSVLTTNRIPLHCCCCCCCWLLWSVVVSGRKGEKGKGIHPKNNISNVEGFTFGGIHCPWNGTARAGESAVPVWQCVASFHEIHQGAGGNNPAQLALYMKVTCILSTGTPDKGWVTEADIGPYFALQRQLGRHRRRPKSQIGRKSNCSRATSLTTWQLRSCLSLQTGLWRNQLRSGRPGEARWQTGRRYTAEPPRASSYDLFCHTKSTRAIGSFGLYTAACCDFHWRQFRPCPASRFF